MYCRKCGNKVSDDSKFCASCGYSLKENIGIKNNNKNNADSKAIASLVISLISLFLSFSLSILVFPLEVVGLILGLVSKTKCGQKTAGIVISIISMIISIAVFIIILIAILAIGVSSSSEPDSQIANFENNNVYNWNCRLSDKDNYSVILTLNDNNSYIWSSYENSANNAVYGNFKTTKIDDYNYKIVFNSTNILIDGILQEYISNTTYSVEFNNYNDNFIMTGIDNNSLYYCDEK